MTPAPEALFESRTYAGFVDPETGLYLESPSNLFELFDSAG